jgi:hypothetical protein
MRFLLFDLLFFVYEMGKLPCTMKLVEFIYGTYGLRLFPAEHGSELRAGPSCGPHVRIWGRKREAALKSARWTADARSVLAMRARVRELLAAAHAQTPNERMRVGVGALLESALC